MSIACIVTLLYSHANTLIVSRVNHGCGALMAIVIKDKFLKVSSLIVGPVSCILIPIFSWIFSLASIKKVFSCEPYNFPSRPQAI